MGKTMWRFENLTKYFGPIKALNEVTFSLETGKIYGLVGGNGAGKSTFVKLVTGMLKPSKGKILEDNKELAIHSPRDARRYGIVAAYQEFSLVPDLPVVNNLLLNIEPSKFGFINIDEMIEKASMILERLHVNIPLSKEVAELLPNEKQACEIAKALILNPRLLLLDEPTNYLFEDQRKELFNILSELRSSTKMTIVFISHRIEEIFEICDEAIVLRDGKLVGTFNLKKTSMDEIIKAMVGEAKEYLYITEIAQTMEKKFGQESPLLSIKNLYVDDKVKNISIDVRKGEIVGLAGLMEQGQSELLRALFGLLPFQGTVLLEGREVKIKSPQDALRQGIVYVSGNTLEGVFLSRSVKENISMIINIKKGIYRLVNSRIEEKYALNMVKNLNIICRSLSEPVLFLSGGNRQKVYLARGLTVNPKVLLLDDPLKGVDIMTKKEISKIIKDISHDKVILFFSSDVEELLPVANRILVFFEGKIVGEFTGKYMRKDIILEASVRGKIIGNI